jgi:hypothetical protein
VVDVVLVDGATVEVVVDGTVVTASVVEAAEASPPPTTTTITDIELPVVGSVQFCTNVRRIDPPS